MPTLGRYLKNQIAEHGAQHTFGVFAENLENGNIGDADVSLRELAESLMGPQWDQAIFRGERVLRAERPIGVFTESGDAVDSSMFADITGQILFQEIKTRYNSQEFVGDKLCRVMPVTNKNLGEEKIPYLSSNPDAPPNVQEGHEYPRTQFTQQYVILPAPQKFGEICDVTMEMIASDHTMQAREAAGGVGERVRIMKEERILAGVLGLSGSIYKFNSSTGAATYQTSTPYINKKSSTPLSDADSINVAEQLLYEMTDPVSGKPIVVNPTALLVMPYNYRKARRIMGADGLRVGDGASSTLATYTPDYLDTDYPVLRTRYGYNLLQASATPTGNELAGGGISAANAREYWLLGNFPRAFVWRQVFPLQTFVAPPLNPAEFSRDIVLSVKAREYGAFGVYDPRYVVMLYNS